MGCTRSFDAGLLTDATGLAPDRVASATEDLLTKVLTAMLTTELDCKKGDTKVQRARWGVLSFTRLYLVYLYLSTASGYIIDDARPRTRMTRNSTGSLIELAGENMQHHHLK
jgi:hypothetical protein